MVSSGIKYENVINLLLIADIFMLLQDLSSVTGPFAVLLQALSSAIGPLCWYYRHCHLQLDHRAVITGFVICNWTIVLFLQALSSATGPSCCVIIGFVICNWTIVLCYYRLCHLQLDHRAVLL